MNDKGDEPFGVCWGPETTERESEEDHCKEEFTVKEFLQNRSMG